MKNLMRKKQRAYFWLMGQYEKMIDLDNKIIVTNYNGCTTYKEAVKAHKKYTKMWKGYNKKYGK